MVAAQTFTGIAILVGVEDYSNLESEQRGSLSFPQVKNDIACLKRILGTSEYTVHTITENIFDNLQTLILDDIPIQSDPITIFLYFSGHGAKKHDQYYFLTSDTEYKEGTKEIDVDLCLDGESLSDLLEHISAQNVVIIFNTCFASAISERECQNGATIDDKHKDLVYELKLSSINKKYLHTLYNKIKKPKKLVIISASGDDHPYSYIKKNDSCSEDYSCLHSVFGKHLIHILRESKKENKELKVDDLFRVLSRRVKAEKIYSLYDSQPIIQTPIIFEAESWGRSEEGLIPTFSIFCPSEPESRPNTPPPQKHEHHYHIKKVEQYILPKDFPIAKRKPPDLEAQFINQVADLYRLMGFQVDQNVNILEEQILILTYTLPGGTTTKTAVACKYVREGKLQKKQVIDSIRVLQDLKRDDKAQNLTIVTTKGFPEDIWEKTQNKIQLLTFRQLQLQVVNFEHYLNRLIKDYQLDELSHYYVDLRAWNTQQTLFDPIDDYINTWLADERSNHLSILGGYGSGKTSFCRKLTHDLALRHKQDSLSTRIPLLVNLRDYAKTVSVRQLITDLLINEYGFRGMDFTLFENLNANGLFVLIFDGFDEMAQRVILDIAYANFAQIAQLAKPQKSKVVLTCRTEFFRTQKIVQEILVEGATTEEEILEDIARRQNFDIIYLEVFSDTQIQEFLQKRVPLLHTSHGWKYYYTKIHTIFDLKDLAKRPVLLELLTRYLPRLIKQKKTITAASLYETVIEKEIERKKIGKTIIEKKDRIQLMTLLAWWMCNHNKFTVYWVEIPTLLQLADHFKLSTKRDIEIHLHDFLTCSFLNRDHQGNYQFSHRSFVEYLVGTNLARASPEERPNLIKEFWAFETATQRAIVSLGSKEVNEVVISDTKPLLIGDEILKLIWLQAWVNYHVLEPSAHVPLPIEDVYVKSSKRQYLRYEKKKLVELNLGGCNLTSLPENLLEMLQDLEHLDLSQNRLQTLPESFGNLTGLKILNLYDNPLVSLPQSLSNLKTILSKNYPQVKESEALILYFLEQNLGRPIPRLDNSNRDFGFSAKKTHVVELSLSNQNLRSLPESFSQLQHLKTLNLSYNEFTSLPASLGNLTNLQRLDLDSNKFTSLPESFFQLKGLQTLGLASNQFTSLPETLGNLENLKELYLDNNQLASLPASFGQLTQLVEVSLSYNNLTSLPESLFQLTGLQTLDLSHNKLASLPASFGNLTNLQHLNLAHSKLSFFPGSFFPANFKNLINLKKLYLFHKNENFLRRVTKESRYKVVCLGDGGEGKTSLFNRGILGTFKIDLKMTILVDFHTYKTDIDGSTVFLQLWDIAGVERFRSIQETLVRGARVIILAFELNSIENFLKLDGTWMVFLRESAPNTPIMLIGTKCDLPHAVTQEMIEEFMASHSGTFIGYLPTSSITGENTKEVFHKIAQFLHKQSTQLNEALLPLLKKRYYNPEPYEARLNHL